MYHVQAGKALLEQYLFPDVQSHSDHGGDKGSQERNLVVTTTPADKSAKANRDDTLAVFYFGLFVLSFSPPWLVLFWYTSLFIPLIGVGMCAVGLTCALTRLVKAKDCTVGLLHSTVNWYCAMVVLTLFVNSIATGCAESYLKLWMSVLPLLVTLLPTAPAAPLTWTLIISIAYPTMYIFDWYMQDYCRSVMLPPFLQNLLDVALELSMVWGVFGLAIIYRRRTEAILSALAKQKEELLREKVERETFLLTASHDIRTPLFGIGAAADLMDESRLAPSCQGYLHSLRSCVAVLRHLMDALFAYSKFSARKGNTAPEKLDRDTFFSNIWNLMSVLGRAAGTSITMHIAPEFPPYLLVESSIVLQILTNLLSNAFKFCPKAGCVGVHSTVLDQDGLTDYLSSVTSIARETFEQSLPRSSCHYVLLEVEDTGTGIPEALRRDIFQPFRQVSFFLSSPRGIRKIQDCEVQMKARKQYLISVLISFRGSLCSWTPPPPVSLHSQPVPGSDSVSARG